MGSGKNPPKHQWLFLVPLKGGIGSIVHPPIGRKNTTYIPCLRLGVKNATDPTELRGTSSTTIENITNPTRVGHLGAWKEISTGHADVLINVNRGEQPLGMPLGSVETIIQYITKTPILIFWIVFKMYSTCNLAFDIGFQNIFAANILSTKSVYEEVCDPM